MKWFSFSTTFFIFLFYNIFLSLNIYSQTISTYCQDGEIYIKIKDNADIIITINESKSSNVNNIPFLEPFIRKYEVTNIFRPFDILNSKVLHNIYKIEFNNISKVNDFIDELRRLEFIQYAEKVPIYKLCYEPNDPLYKSTAYGYNWSWWLDKVKAQKAWDISKGSASVLVGIVDNAFWTTHPDLKGQFIYSKDVADNDSDVNPPIGLTNTEQYEWSHGTHIAGMIAAIQDNNVGITGIAPQVKLVVAKSSSDNNASTIVEASAGVAWVANQGVKVINMSYGSPEYSNAEQDLMTQCYNSGIVLVASAGNDGYTTNEVLYPAAYDNVIAVGATNEDDKRAYFSEYGTWLDISAPGGWSPKGLTGPDDTNNQMIPILSTTFCDAYYLGSIFSGQKYDGMIGTSMSAPVITGIAGLMFSINSSLTPIQIETCLKTTALNIDALNPGFEGKLGVGRVDAYEALKCAAGITSLKADFTADNTIITPGKSVNFSDLTTGNPTSYQWSFQGGLPGISTDKNPKNIVFNYVGKFKVTLIVNNGSSSNTLEKVDYIIVNPDKAKCDTLNYPFQGSSYRLTRTSNGWATGNNGYGMTANAQFFNSYDPANAITAARIWFGYATGNDNDFAKIAIWKDNNGKPSSSTPIFTQDISLGIIKTDVTNQYYFDVIFNNPYIITGAFYLGIIYPTVSGDTVAIVTNSPGDATTVNSWALMKGSWSNFKTLWGGNLNVDLAIFPIVCQIPVSIAKIPNTYDLKDVSIYPNPADNFITVEFLDNISDIENISVYSSIGSLIKAFDKEIIYSGRLLINTSNQIPGIYFICIKTKGKFITKKYSIVR